MKIWNLGRRSAWILLIVFHCSKLWAQLTPVIKPETDSAIRAEFVRNAKRIHADLIGGDYYQAQLVIRTAELETRSAQLQTAQGENLQLKQAAQRSAEDREAEAKRRRRLQMEVWGWRLLGLFTLYQAIK